MVEILCALQKEKGRKIYKNIQESQKSLKFIQERRKYEERVL